MKLSVIINNMDDEEELNKLYQKVKDKEIKLEYEFACQRNPELEVVLKDALLVVSDLRSLRKKFFDQIKDCVYYDQPALTVFFRMTESLLRLEDQLNQNPGGNEKTLEFTIKMTRNKLRAFWTTIENSLAEKKNTKAINLLKKIRQKKADVTTRLDWWKDLSEDYGFTLLDVFPSLKADLDDLKYL